MNAQGVHPLPLKTRNRTNLKADTAIDQLNFGLFRVATEQLQIYIGMAGSSSMPNRPSDMGAKGR
jgi:hypothetical protein